MTIALSPEQEPFVAQAMQEGGYQNADDGWLHEQRDAVSAKIECAFEQFERGEFYTDQQSRARIWSNAKPRGCVTGSGKWKRSTRFLRKRRITGLRSGSASRRTAPIWQTGSTMSFTRSSPRWRGGLDRAMPARI